MKKIIYLFAFLLIISDLFSQSAETSMRIISNPADAVVFINGEERGVTPVKLDIKPGEILIRLELEEYSPKEMSLYLREGQKRTVQMQMDELDVNVEILVDPQDTDISVNGVRQDNKPSYRVPSGINTFYFEKPGYHSLKKVINYKPGNQTLNITLDKKTKTGALRRSVFLPGWGQLYQDKYQKTYYMSALFLVSSVGVALSVKEYNETMDSYNYSYSLYKEAFDEAAINKYKKEAKNKYNDLERMELIRNVLIYSSVAVWLWSMLDTVLVPPDWQESSVVSTRVIKDNVLVKLSFKF